MRFYKFHEKWTCGIFQVFCIKIQQLKVLELIVMIYFGRNLVFWWSWCFLVKRSQNSFSSASLMKNEYMEYFFHFLHEVTIELMIFLEKILFWYLPTYFFCFFYKKKQNGEPVLRFLGQKCAILIFFRYCKKSVLETLLVFYMKLHEVAVA